jgi:hypothetical protein
MRERLAGNGMDARCLAYFEPGGPMQLPDGWRPDVAYVVFSSEEKALRTIDAAAAQMPGTVLVLGRSLLRASFLQRLGGRAGEFWFVDTDFRVRGRQSPAQRAFFLAVTGSGIAVPTTNHAFGWDALAFCAEALRAGGGRVRAAIEYLESGVTLDGAGGPCRFAPDDHNGRHGAGPTILSRWTEGRLEETTAA